MVIIFITIVCVKESMYNTMCRVNPKGPKFGDFSNEDFPDHVRMNNMEVLPMPKDRENEGLFKRFWYTFFGVYRRERDARFWAEISILNNVEYQKEYPGWVMGYA